MVTNIPRRRTPLKRICLLAAVCFLGMASANAVEGPSLPEHVIHTGGQDITMVTFRGEEFRRVLIEDLDRPERWQGQLVCVEGKFEEVTGTQTVANEEHLVFVLAGSRIPMLYPLRLGRLGLIRGDNVWVGGLVEKIPGAETLRIRVRGTVKLPGDLELFEERYQRYTRTGDYRKLLQLGDWMGRAGENALVFTDKNEYRRKQRTAYKKGLALWSGTSDPNDAEVQYRIARKYLELLDDEVQAQRHLLRCVSVDPSHKAAINFLKQFGYIYAGEFGCWMTRREYLRRKSSLRTPVTTATSDPARDDSPGNTADDTPGNAADTQTGTQPQQAVRMTEQERSERRRQIIGRCLSGNQREITVLMAEAGEVEDPGMAVFLAESLRMRPERQALTGLKKLTALENNDVTLAVLQSLLFRPEPTAKDDFLNVAAKLEGKNLTERAVALLAEEPERVSVPLLVEMLGLGNQQLAEAAEMRLSAVTGENFGTYEEWRSWWGKNSANYR